MAKKRKGTKKHAFDVKVLVDLHKEMPGTDNGACLNRHVPKCLEDNSCSHRWQGWKKAKDNPTLYNYPAYSSICATPTCTTYIRFRGGALKIPVPEKRPSPGDWDLDASTYTYPNFRKYAKFPFLHNTHHIIPDSVLNCSIYEVAHQKNSFTLYKLIRQGLLKAKYNLNHKDNTIILPMPKVVAKALNLPRHTSAAEAEPGVQPETADHEAYSDAIRDHVKSIIDGYAKLLDNATNDHEEEPSQLSKSQLESLSRRVFSNLIKWGKTIDGRSLVEAPDWVFQ